MCGRSRIRHSSLLSLLRRLSLHKSLSTPVPAACQDPHCFYTLVCARVCPR
ncbi:hypothetical protein, conserved [Leishmania donovani]|uniref:Uncharacterized protein n=1 Tax=Leishmania donovani TaxID=5661 RepID=E9B831_LEIDO|nr:hypothetical protein, conserved [Leishmania donovani]CBZ31404.1 hypothetical protein, conserved [Leishmania donovani]